MKNIMKAQLYQVGKSKFLLLLVFVFCFIQFSVMLGEVNYYDTVKTAGSLIAGMGSMLLFGAIPLAVLITAEFCGADFMDKTVNYELLGGYRRKDVYFAKAVLSIVFGILAAMLASMIPFVVAMAAGGGFGEELSGGWLLVRYLLLVFPFFNLICMFVCITFVVKNGPVVMGGGLVVCFTTVFMTDMVPPAENAALWSFSGMLQKLTDFSSWSTYALVGEREITMYRSALELGDIVSMAVMCVLTGCLFLWIGYRYYLKDDLS